MSRLKTFLESRDFYELCQIYRHMPVEKPGDVVEAFETLKNAILVAAAVDTEVE